MIIFDRYHFGHMNGIYAAFKKRCQIQIKVLPLISVYFAARILNKPLCDLFSAKDSPSIHSTHSAIDAKIALLSNHWWTALLCMTCPLGLAHTQSNAFLVVKSAAMHRPACVGVCKCLLVAKTVAINVYALHLHVHPWP